MPLRTRHLTVWFLLTAMFLMVGLSEAQSPTTRPAPDRSVRVSANLSPARGLLPPWRQERPSDALLSDSAAATERLRTVAARREGDGHAVSGVLIGGVVGILACEAFANGMSDSGDGHCSLEANVVLGAVGAILGGLIGWLIK